MLVLAHAGHWMSQLLYVVPVAVVLVGLWITSRRDAARQASESEP